MTKRVVFLLLFLIGFSFADIRWYSLEDGLKKAEKERKYVLIYITSKHCHYCREMDKTTFKDDKVQRYLNTYFVPIKVEKTSKEGLLVRKKYGYMGTPTFHFLEADGKKIKTLFGAWNKEEFLKILKFFAEKHYKKESMTEYFMKN